MYNIVKQNGRDVHIVIKPDKGCEVNSGLGSIRGARQGEESFSETTGTQMQRLTDAAGLALWRSIRRPGTTPSISSPRSRGASSRRRARTA